LPLSCSENGRINRFSRFVFTDASQPKLKNRRAAVVFPLINVVFIAFVWFCYQIDKSLALTLKR